MNWLYYLIEANIYLTIFYAFYHFFLKNETLYVSNRWFLIGISILAFVLPLISIKYIQPIASVSYTKSSLIYDLPLVTPVINNTPTDVIHAQQFNLTTKEIIPIAYQFVVLFLIVSMLAEILQIINLYRKSKREKREHIIYIELQSHQEKAFSFFNWLFLHPNMYANKVVIIHEKIHIQQGHSYDILFFELLKCFNWFNPIIYLLFKDAKLNHEYISDREASTYVKNKYEYASLLIAHAYVPKEHLSHSAFTTTQLEQRIKQLGKQKSNQKAFLKYASLLPILILLFFISAFKIEKSYSYFNFSINQSVKKQTSKTALTADSRQKEDGVTNIKPVVTKLENVVPELKLKLIAEQAPVLQEVSELIGGPKRLDQIVAELATKGKKLYARDYVLFWTINEQNTVIRKPTHSVFLGKEAQLFRGNVADTLYVDQGFYSIKGNVINVEVENLLIGSPNTIPNDNKMLIVVDAAKRQVVKVLDQVDIRTKALINKVISNPDYGDVKNEPIDTLSKKYVDVKRLNADKRYIISMQNTHIREARITANDVIANDSNLPKGDPWQASILW